MTRRRGVPADEDEGLRTVAACFAPVSTIVGKTWDLHLEKVVRVGRDENLAMIAESVAFLAARASASSTTPSTSSTPGAPTRPTRWRACGPLPRRGAERVVLCDTNGSSLPHEIGAATAAVVAAAGRRASRVGIHCHNDPECGVANSLAAVSSRRARRSRGR